MQIGVNRGAGEGEGEGGRGTGTGTGTEGKVELDCNSIFSGSSNFIEDTL